MRKVFLDGLPRKGKLINWRESVGYKVQFIYDNIEGEFFIIGYSGGNRYLKIKYKDDEFNIFSGSILECKLGNVIGKYSKDYHYDIGDVMENVVSGKLKIIDQIRQEEHKHKGYVYECLICGNIDTIAENSLNKKHGCNVCSGLRVRKGYNDLSTTHPEVAKLLLVPEDGLKYSAGSHKKVNWKCRDCGEIVKSKIVKNVIKYGLSCQKCSDGYSYPEKLMSNALSQVGVYFEPQKIFDWSNNKKYDFYIPSLNCIVETHGSQHYCDSGFSRSLVEEKHNDQLKLVLAKDNNIKHYIVIDCSKSDVEFIKNNVCKSELGNLIDFNIVDWEQCSKNASNSLIKIASSLYSEGKTLLNISVELMVHRSTLIKYLKKGSLLGLCDYNPKDEQKKACLKTHKLNKKKIVRMSLNAEYINEYDSIVEAAQQLNLDRTSISMACSGKLKTSGGYKWMFKRDYENLFQLQAN